MRLIIPIIIHLMNMKLHNISLTIFPLSGITAQYQCIKKEKNTIVLVPYMDSAHNMDTPNIFKSNRFYRHMALHVLIKHIFDCYCVHFLKIFSFLCIARFSKTTIDSQYGHLMSIIYVISVDRCKKGKQKQLYYFVIFCGN